MKKRLIISFASLSLILLSFVVISITFGWTFGVVDFTGHTVAVGDLRYTKSGAFISEEEILYPGMELIDQSIALTNESPITSQMRVKIVYTRITNPTGSALVIEDVAYENGVDDHLDVVFDATYTYDSDYWYYGDSSTTIAADSGSIPILSSIQYDGFVTGNDYSSQTITITVTIEVKQDDNVNWTELTSYDFSTGYPL